MAKDKEIQSRQVAPRYSDPFGTLRSEMDRLFDSFMGGLPTFPSMFGPGGSQGFALSPSMDVKCRPRCPNVIRSKEHAERFAYLCTALPPYAWHTAAQRARQVAMRGAQARIQLFQSGDQIAATGDATVKSFSSALFTMATARAGNCKTVAR